MNSVSRIAGEARLEPRAARIGLTLFGRVARGKKLAVIVRDLSSGGFCADAAAPPEPGTDLIVSLPGLGEVGCRVKWAHAGRFGAEFVGGDDLRRMFLGRVGAPYATWIEPRRS